jgi:capsular polysaccharide biosynthesis protein
MEVLEIRRAWLIPAAVLLGVLVGIAVSLVSSTSRKAEAQVLISSPSGTAAVTPFLPNLRELAKSGVLAGNVRSTLRLKESIAELRDHVDAEVAPQSQVIVLSATDEDADRARQIAQEAAVVFTQLVQSRFGQRSPPLQAALTDSAQVLSESNRHFVRNALIGGVLGLVLGLLTALLLQGGRLAEGAPGLPEGAVRGLSKLESQLEQRVKTVSARERELARRAGQLASRERDLERRASELDVREDESATRVDRPGAQEGEEPAAKERELELRPSPEQLISEPALASEPATPSPVTPGDVWNLPDLEHAVEAHADASPEQAEEWRTYLYFLREYASADGALPPGFSSLIGAVFAELFVEPSSSAR